MRTRARSAEHDGEGPRRSPVALLLLDVINDLEFPAGEDLLRHALPMASRLARFAARARQAGIPVIYVNDNYGRWQSDFRRLTAYCRRAGARVKPIVDLLAPASDDYFVLKPKHSGFFSTALSVLLRYLGARTLILTGMAGNICVLFTANDAYMRDYRLLVPADCIASEKAADNQRALATMATLLKADVRPSTEVRLFRLLDRSRGRPDRAETSRSNSLTGGRPSGAPRLARRGRLRQRGGPGARGR
jgi:nicotinamidase-related amidase